MPGIFFSWQITHAESLTLPPFGSIVIGGISGTWTIEKPKENITQMMARRIDTPFDSTAGYTELGSRSFSISGDARGYEGTTLKSMHQHWSRTPVRLWSVTPESSAASVTPVTLPSGTSITCLVMAEYLETSSSTTWEKKELGKVTLSIPPGGEHGYMSPILESAFASWGLNKYSVNRYLVPIDFEDEEDYSGLDTISPEKWLMVPQEGHNRAYVLSGSGFDLKVIPDGLSYLSPTPSSLTSHRELLRIV